MLRLYDVRWLVVGPRERETYGADVAQRIDQWATEGWITPEFSSGAMVIYEVRSQ